MAEKEEDREAQVTQLEIQPLDDVPSCRWSHLLVEVDSMEPLTAPIKASGRIVYTSLGVSEHYVAVGCNVGTLYIFNRLSLKYLFMWPAEKDSGSVSQISFAPDDNVLGYGTSQGFLVVVELNIDKRSKAEKVRSTGHHKGALITSLSWNSEGSKLFAGDNAGKVSVANVPTNKRKDLLKLPSEIIMRLESPIVQIDAFYDKLVVSTTKKTYMGNTTKDGHYGCCFYPVSGMETPVMYCARPGSRLWEVDYDGTVLNTHQFKRLLDVPPLPIVSALGEDSGSYTAIEEHGPGPQTLAFPHLLLCGERYLVSCCDNKIYVFNPGQVQTVLWTNTLEQGEYGTTPQ